MLEEATLYLKMGLTPMPLKGVYGKTYDESKRPLLDTWASLQTTKPTTESIKMWFRKWPKASVGLVTGPTSGLLVLDIDVKKGGRLPEGVKIDPTWTVKTKNGYHFYFKWIDELNDHATTTQSKVFPNVDTRGKGGYVVAPPSPNYSWKFSPRQKPLINPPAWLVWKLTQKKTVKAEVSEFEQSHWISDLWEGVEKGQNRRKGMIKLLSYFLAKKLPLDFTYTLLKEWNEKNSPPIEESALDKDFKDILSRFESGKYRSTIKGHEEDVDEAEKEVEVTTSEQTANAYMKFIDDKLTRPEIELPFGFKNIDAITGGLLRGNLDTVGALTKGGKTLFILQILQHNIKAGKTVVYFPTEMGNNEILERYFAMTAHIPIRELQTGRMTPESREALKEAIARYKESNFNLIRNHEPTLNQIMRTVEKVKADILVIDYIQHVRLDVDNKTKHLEQFVKDLKKFTMDANIATLITAQPSKAKRDFKNGCKIVDMTIHDFADSSIVEKESSRIFLLHNGPNDPESATRNMRVEITNRHGESGETTLVFDKKKVWFYD